MAFSPGPNNLMLASSGASFGFRKSLPHMFGIVVGFETLVVGSSLGLSALLETSPKVSLSLKCIGAAYLIYLAFKIGTSDASTTPSSASRPPASGAHNSAVGGARPLTFLQAACFQPLNPKAWFAAFSGIATYMPHDLPIMTRTSIAFLAFLLPAISSVTAWSAFGRSIRCFFADPEMLKRFNQVTAVILLGMIGLLFL